MTALHTGEADSIGVRLPEVVDDPEVAPPDPSPRRDAERRRRLRPNAALLLGALAALAALALWFVFFSLVLTGFQEHGSQARLYAKFRSELALATAPIGAPIQPASPIALLDAPAGGLHHQVVVEGTTAENLTHGPGHLPDTPLPGQPGVSVILGRSVTYGGPFGGITGFRPGDRIRVTTGQGVFTYRVDRVRYPGAPLPPPPQPDRSQLMLVTSAGHGWRTGWAPEQAVYVDASLPRVQTQRAPAGLPSAITVASLPMHGDMTALVALVFWLQALLLVGAALAWSWVRWGRWQTWIAGLPLLLAALWGVSGAADLLLPNLI